MVKKALKSLGIGIGIGALVMSPLVLIPLGAAAAGFSTGAIAAVTGTAAIVGTSSGVISYIVSDNDRLPINNGDILYKINTGDNECKNSIEKKEE